MKKSLLSLTAIVFGITALGGAVSALDISDIFSKDGPTVGDAYSLLLNDYSDDWGYTNDLSLTCSSEGGVIKITSPKVEDGIFETAPEYRLFISPYRISQIKNNDIEVNNSNIKMMEEKIEGNETVTFKVSESDIDPNGIYYGFVTPIDMYDVVGTPSKEICFHLNSNMCMLDTDCDALELIVNPTPSEPEVLSEAEDGNNEEFSDGHNAAGCVGMSLAHVSHTKNGNKLTLTWTDVGGENVDISIFNPDEEIYEKLDTVKMNSEKYVYTLRWNGEQNFLLSNECGEVRYKADAAVSESEPEIVTPATGPAENILYIAIAAIVLYGAYTIFGRKSEN